jgi:hypothetical protein
VKAMTTPARASSWLGRQDTIDLGCRRATLVEPFGRNVLDVDLYRYEFSIRMAIIATFRTI